MANVKIVKVWQDGACVDKNGMGITLDVDLDNGAYFVFSLDSKRGDPLFADILMGRYRDPPKTDGERVYWGNGASLSYDEMITMLQMDKRETV